MTIDTQYIDIAINDDGLMRKKCIKLINTKFQSIFCTDIVVSL